MSHARHIILHPLLRLETLPALPYHTSLIHILDSVGIMIAGGVRPVEFLARLYIVCLSIWASIWVLATVIVIALVFDRQHWKGKL